MKQSLIHTLFLFAAILLQAELHAQNIPEIASLDGKDPVLTQIKNGVRSGAVAVRGEKGAQALPSLEFCKYTLKRNDTFWLLLSRTTLNIDTVMTVNALSSPHSLKAGDTVYLPTMRGVIYEVQRGDTIGSIEKDFSVKREYIFAANRISSLSKKFIFIPCGEVTSLERSLFLGTGFAAPLEKLRRTSGFGMRKDPISGIKSFHTGVDLGCKVGTAVYAARAGKVVFAGYKGNYGQLVIVEHPCGYYSYYGHLSRIRVRSGMKVGAQDIIALSGNTGRTTGPHLHFEIRKNAKPVSPVILLR
ncbi:MAG: LysM peptidoglycan-binding domain-containing M23 family metallopeptidase [Spirochaetota bacterium]